MEAQLLHHPCLVLRFPILSYSNYWRSHLNESVDEVKHEYPNFLQIFLPTTIECLKKGCATIK